MLTPLEAKDVKAELVKSPSEVSPCIRLCKIDPTEGICTGCYRTLEEISSWRNKSVDERLKLMRELSSRKMETCPKCKTPRSCLMEQGKSASTCWCMTVTHIDKDDMYEYDRCLCKNCLLERVNS